MLRSSPLYQVTIFDKKKIIWISHRVYYKYSNRMRRDHKNNIRIVEIILDIL